ncbi:MAG: LysM peptidoglycan-binding domain-containing protein [Candidatus Humimicrobiaceae bacterium]
MDAGEMKARMDAEKKAKDEALKRKSQAEILAGVRRASSAGSKPSLGATIKSGVRPMGADSTPSGSVKTPFIPGASIGSSSAQTSKYIAEYTVKKGDTLSKIAKDFYGFSAQPYWKLIQDANKDTIKDANLIYPGQVFKIPILPQELKKK